MPGAAVTHRCEATRQPRGAHRPPGTRVVEAAIPARCSSSCGASTARRRDESRRLY